MSGFKVEKNTTTDIAVKRRVELIKQIESLQKFYYDIGYDTSNIRTIFSLTLSYLKGHVNSLVIKSFFDVLMNKNKLNFHKEINLLNCFDDLIEELEYKEGNPEPEEQLELNFSDLSSNKAKPSLKSAA
jgi:hypothetical protein